MKTYTLISALALTLMSAQCSADEGTKPIPVKTEAPKQPMEKVEKTDTEWREKLTPEQIARIQAAKAKKKAESAE